MIDIRFWRTMAPVAYVVSLLLLVAVDVMGFVGMGAQRWIELGPIQIQPSEMMKIALVMALAAYYNWLPPEKVSRIFWVILPLLLILMPVALVLEQPDLGTAILLLAGGGAVMFLAGVSLWYFGFAVASVVGVVTAVLKSHGTSWQLLHEYQFKRIFTFLDPAADPLGAGYHITQAKIAMGSGGLVGRGYMQGTQSRLNFLPEKHTDFILTTLAEEFGFVGTAALLDPLCADRGLLHRLGDLEPRPLRRAPDRRRRLHLPARLRDQHGDGDGPDAGGRRAAAARLLRRVGDDRAAGRLRPGAERARAPAAQPGLSMGPRILFSAPEEQWPLWRPHLLAAFAEAGLDVALTDDPAGAWTFDYVIYQPGGPVADFTPFTRLKAVLSLWAGVERIVGDPTLDGAALPHGRPGADAGNGRSGWRRTCCATTSARTRTCSGRTGSGGTGWCRRWRRSGRWRCSASASSGGRWRRRCIGLGFDVVGLEPAGQGAAGAAHLLRRGRARRRRWRRRRSW